VLVNRVDDERDGIAAFKRLAVTARKFLGVSIEYGGSVPRDAAFVAADRAQSSVYSVAAASNAAGRISQLVQSMQAWRLGRYAVNEY
jgi:MinD-like ATPase involved in chromosome partitioning or flagellar assembly